MNREFIDWLTTERLPMFDIHQANILERWVPDPDDGRKTPLRQAYVMTPEWYRQTGVPQWPEALRASGYFLGESWVVNQRHPPKEALFECVLDELLPLVQQHFPQLRTAVGEVALRKAIEDLRLCPWWRSAGPITEEIRFLMREGFKGLARIQRQSVMRSPVSKLLNHPP